MILSTGIYALVKDVRDIYRVHDFLLYITRDFEEHIYQYMCTKT